MKLRHLITLSAALLIFFPACKDDDDDAATGTPAAGSGIYPLVIGHKWKYYKEFHFINDTTLTDTLMGSGYYIKRVDRNETLTNGDVTFAVEYEDSTSSGIGNVGTSFYYMNSTGLYSPAYVYGSSPSVFLIHPKPILYKVGEMEFTSLAELFRTLTDRKPSATDSIIFDTPPRWVIKNPLVLDELWTYITYPFLIKKKYVGMETVHTVFGNFSCKKIEWFYDIGGDGTWDDIHLYQYISPTKGLLKETLNISVTLTDCSGNPIGTGTAHEESIAISVNF